MEWERPFGMEEYYMSRTDEVNLDPLNQDIGGEHYKSSYQPIQLMEDVRMFACCSYILKYVYRHKNKGGKQDLEKALHCCELMQRLGENWYHEPQSTSCDKFYHFIQCNKQLDANQIRAILAICNRDMKMLKTSISSELSECYC